MSYTATKHRNGLGGIADVASAVVNVASDPCLGQVAALVNDLHNLEQRTPTRGALGDTATPGIGLCRAVGPLKIAVWVRKHPVAVPMGAIALVAGLLTLGYVLGKEAPRR